MAPSRKVDFRQAALASGLISQQELDAALTELRAAHAEQGRTATYVTDRELADHLVATRRLSTWQAEQLLAGRTKWRLGAYQIVGSLGQGGMGQVFKAEHPIMRRTVAIKVLPADRCTPEAVEHFRREIQALANLDHENLVRAYDAGQDGNVHFLVTEYVPGLDLRKLVKRAGRLSMRAAAAIICQAAQGLDHAHSRGLIHRDVKPGNLLVTPDGMCKVSDLGLVGYAHELAGQKVQVVGTADYLSPEILLTPQNLTPASDVYSLGCTLYYAVTGKVPFPGGTTRDKARKHLEEQPLDPRRLNPELDPAFCDVIFAMMAKDPKQRVPTCARVIELLRPWAGNDWRTAAAQLSEGPAPRAVLAPPPLPPIPAIQDDSQLTDTKPLPEVEERPESPSQVSEPTHPAYAYNEETLPAVDLDGYPVIEGGVPALVWAVIGLSIMTVVAVVVGILMLTLRP